MIAAEPTLRTRDLTVGYRTRHLTRAVLERVNDIAILKSFGYSDLLVIGLVAA